MIAPDSRFAAAGETAARSNNLRRTVDIGGNAARGGLDKRSVFCNCDHRSRQAGQSVLASRRMQGCRKQRWWSDSDIRRASASQGEN